MRSLNKTIIMSLPSINVLGKFLSLTEMLIEGTEPGLSFESIIIPTIRVLQSRGGEWWVENYYEMALKARFLLQ